MKQISFLSTMLLAATLLSATPSFITVQPATQTVIVGQTVSFDLLLNGVTDLVAWQVDLAYNPSVLSLTAILYGSLLTTVSQEDQLVPNIDNTAGLVSRIGAYLLDFSAGGFTGSGQLVSLEFLAVGVGQSLISPLNVILLDSTFADILNDQSLAQQGIITVIPAATSEVPEPATLCLSALSLGVLALVKRSRIS